MSGLSPPGFPLRITSTVEIPLLFSKDRCDALRPDGSAALRPRRRPDRRFNTPEARQAGELWRPRWPTSSKANASGCHSEVSPRGQFRIDTVGNMIKGEAAKAPRSCPARPMIASCSRWPRTAPTRSCRRPTSPRTRAMTPEELGLLKLWIDCRRQGRLGRRSPPPRRAVELGSIGAAGEPATDRRHRHDRRRPACRVRPGGSRPRVRRGDRAWKSPRSKATGISCSRSASAPTAGKLAAGSYQLVTLWDAPEGGRGQDVPVATHRRGCWSEFAPSARRTRA